MELNDCSCLCHNAPKKSPKYGVWRASGLVNTSTYEENGPPQLREVRNSCLQDSPRSSHRGTVETNLTRNHEVAGSTPGLAQWVKDPAVAVSCVLGC